MVYQAPEKVDFTEFDKLTAINRTPAELIKLMILEARYNLRESLDAYYLRKESGLPAQRSIIIVKVRLRSLLFELDAWLKRSFKGYDQVPAILAGSNEADILSLINDLNGFLDNQKLTKIDNEQFDTKNAALEDRNKGYG